MTERRQPRVLGAKRTITDVLGTRAMENAEANAIIKRVVTGTLEETVTLGQLERVVAHYASRNSEYTRVGVDDIRVLAAEILNNSIRAILLFGDFSLAFSDVEVYSISVAMQYNLSVEAFTMNAVNLSDEAVSMLCEALVKSRVSFIDMSNIPLEDEAGRSLAALAHVNPYVRTVVLDDTLIAGDILDEIDVVCQFNQSNFEANNFEVEMKDEAEMARLRHRLQHVILARYNRTFYCVDHLFCVCPNGDLCLNSHSLMTTGAPDANANLHERIASLFATEGSWQDKLPAPPVAGASWRDPNDEERHALRLNLVRCRRMDAKRTNNSGDNEKDVGNKKSRWRGQLLGVGVTAATMLMVVALWATRRR